MARMQGNIVYCWPNTFNSKNSSAGLQLHGQSHTTAFKSSLWILRVDAPRSHSRWYVGCVSFTLYQLHFINYRRQQAPLGRFLSLPVTYLIDLAFIVNKGCARAPQRSDVAFTGQYSSDEPYCFCTSVLLSPISSTDISSDRLSHKFPPHLPSIRQIRFAFLVMPPHLQHAKTALAGCRRHVSYWCSVHRIGRPSTPCAFC